MFTAIFLILFFGLWVICGSLVWLVVSVATRGEAGMLSLPLAMFAACVAGLLVPLLIRDDGIGLWLSPLAAIAAAGIVVGARLWARDALALERSISRDGEVDS